MCGFKMRIYKYDKKGLLEQIKQALTTGGDIEINFYNQHFEYNGESLEEMEKIFDRWHENEVLYKMQYDSMKIKEAIKLMNELTEEFISKEEQSNEEVLEFLYQINKIKDKYRKTYPGSIKPDTNAIATKLRELGYTSIYDNTELKSYNGDFEVMTYISDDKENIENILISESMENISRRLFDPKVGKGITAYHNRYQTARAKSKAKIKD